jgi:hypothetical protein
MHAQHAATDCCLPLVQHSRWQLQVCLPSQALRRKSGGSRVMSANNILAAVSRRMQHSTVSAYRCIRCGSLFFVSLPGCRHSAAPKSICDQSRRAESSRRHGTAAIHDIGFHTVHLISQRTMVHLAVLKRSKRSISPILLPTEFDV